MFSAEPSFWQDRVKASFIHLGLSLAVAAIAALLVFAIWYPYPYREISGGRELFLLVVAVDVVLGPLITLAVFNRMKTRAVLSRDLTVVGLLQLAALGYGLWTVYIARPVHLVFEVDRFRAVHAIEVPLEMLSKISSKVNAMPITGPSLLSLRPFKDAKEKSDVTMEEIEGLPLAARPDFWQPYPEGVSGVIKAARPVNSLKERFGSRTADIERAIAATGRPAATLAYLPLVSRNLTWTVLLDTKTADVVGYLALDPF